MSGPDHPDAAWISPSVELYGDIRIHRGASLWPKVVCRAERLNVVYYRNALAYRDGNHRLWSEPGFDDDLRAARKRYAAERD